MRQNDQCRERGIESCCEQILNLASIFVGHRSRAQWDLLSVRENNSESSGDLLNSTVFLFLLRLSYLWFQAAWSAFCWPVMTIKPGH